MAKIIDARARFNLRAKQVLIAKRTAARSRPVAQRVREGFGTYTLYGSLGLSQWIEENTWPTERQYIFQQIKAMIKEMDDETD